MKINILLCDTFPGLLPPYIPSYVSMFTKLFDGVDPHAEYEVYRTMDGQTPETFNPNEVYLITGCNQSVYDDTAWIKNLLAWIRTADKARAKLVGVCFGHQAIAEALRGKVERARNGWGVGIRESDITDKAAWEFFPEKKLRLLYNHHDQVTAMPENAVLVAQSGFCPIDSFRIGNHILTFQGHPEYVPEYEEHLIRNFADDEPDNVKQAALDSIRRMNHQGATVAQWIREWGDGNV